MKNALHITTIKPALIIFTGFFAALLSTASFAQTTSGLIDTAAVTDIEVRMADDHLDQFGFTLPLPKMLEGVANNLAQWHFPVHVAGGKSYTHTLEIQIGLIKNDSTPVGFSFSSGNSDPRATEFQKADVIPVSCRLVAKENSKQNAELAMNLSAKGMQPGHATQEKIIAGLIDAATTVCFNLLDDLKLLKPEQSALPVVIKPTWMPQVKIETVTEPVPVTEAGKMPVHSEINNTEERKQIIIHNLGSPLTLKLGHERR